MPSQLISPESWLTSHVSSSICNPIPTGPLREDKVLQILLFQADSESTQLTVTQTAQISSFDPRWNQAKMWWLLFFPSKGKEKRTVRTWETMQWESQGLLYRLAHGLMSQDSMICISWQSAKTPLRFLGRKSQQWMLPVLNRDFRSTDKEFQEETYRMWNKFTKTKPLKQLIPLNKSYSSRQKRKVFQRSRREEKQKNKIPTKSQQ